MTPKWAPETRANTAANVNVSAEPIDSNQPDESRESAGVASAAVPPAWNGRRRRSVRPTEDVELEVANFFPSKWASMSADELVAATTLVQMKNDPNYQSAPVQKKARTPRRNLSRQGRRS